MKDVIKNHVYILRILYSADRRRIPRALLAATWEMLVDLIFGSLLLRYILNCYDKNVSLQNIICVMIILCIHQVGYTLYSNYYKNVFLPVSNQQIFEYIQKMVFTKTKNIEFCKYDNADFYEEFMKAVMETEERAKKSLDTILDLASSILSAIVLLYVVSNIGIVAIVIAVVPIIINAIIGKKVSSKIYDKDMETVVHKKKTDYVKRVFLLKDYCYEIKLSNIASVLFAMYRQANKDINDIHKKYASDIFWRRVSINFFCDIVGYFVTIIYGCYKYIVLHSIPIGDFTFLLTSLSRVTQAIQKVTDQYVEVCKNSKYIDNIRLFLEEDNGLKKSHDIGAGREHHIEFRHVYFRYNENEEYVLEDINLQIRPGEKVAIVGNNGAGKSTLVYLLLRLYEPTEGVILLDGINIKEYNKEEYCQLFSCVFQDFSVFGLSIIENVLCRGALEEDYDVVKNALETTGIYEYLMKNGYSLDTVLTKEFDDKGLNLSGGQLQKLALSRSIIYDKTIGILDEPSSALDPIAEHEFFMRIRDIYNGRSLVFISHRLSSSNSVDKIYFIEMGKIVETGNHDQLMKLDGKYAHMFRTQAKSYKL